MKDLTLIPPCGGGGRIPTGRLPALSANGQVVAFARWGSPQTPPEFAVVDVSSAKTLLEATHSPPPGWKPEHRDDRPPELRVLALSEDGRLCATSTTKDTALWQAGRPDPLWTLDASTGWLEIAGGDLFMWVAGPEGRHVWRVDLDSGDVSARYKLDSPPAALLGDGVVYPSFRELRFLPLGGDVEVLFEGFDDESPLGRVTVAVDGGYVAVASKTTPRVALIDVATRQVTAFDTSEMPTTGDKTESVVNPQLLPSPDGRLLLVSTRLTRVLDTASGEFLHVIDPNEPRVFQLSPWKPLGFFDQNTVLLEGGLLMRFDVRSGEEITDGETFPRQCWSLAISPDGTHALSGHIGFALLWDLKRGTHRRIPVAEDAQVLSMAFDSESRRAWLASPMLENLLEVDLETSDDHQTTQGPTANPGGKSEARDPLPASGEVPEGRRGRARRPDVRGQAILASPDGTAFAVVDGSTILLYRGAPQGTPLKVRSRANDVGHMAFDEPGNLLAAEVGSQIFLWEVAGEKPSELMKIRIPRDGIQGLAITADAVLVFTRNGDLMAHSREDGKKRRLMTHDAHSPGAISPSAGLVVANSGQQATLLTGNGDMIREFQGTISKAVFAREGDPILAAFNDASLVLLSPQGSPDDAP